MKDADALAAAVRVNREALRWYEGNTRYYDSLIDPQPPAARSVALRQLLSHVYPRGAPCWRSARYPAPHPALGPPE